MTAPHPILDPSADEVKEPLGVDLIVAVVAFVVLGLAAANLGSTLGLPLYAGTHALVAAIALTWAFGSGRPPRRQALLLGLSCLFLGPFGAGASIVSILAEAIFRPQARPFSEWFEDIFPDEEAERADILLTRLRAGGDPASGASQLVSFTDVIEYGSIEQKQAIVALIARRFTPAFSAAMRRALEDPVPAVRVQAAAAAAAIEARFADRHMALEAEAQQRQRPIELERALGRHFKEIASSGLLEPARAAAYEDNAFKHYELVLAKEPKDVESLAVTAEILLAKDELGHAATRLEAALDRAETDPRVCRLYFEVLMRMRRFDEVRACARRWDGRFDDSDGEMARMNTAIRFWARAA